MAQKKFVVITDRFTESAYSLLKNSKNIEVFSCAKPDVIPEHVLAEAEALIIRSRTPITEALLKKAKQLQVIVTSTSGFDHIDLNATAKWGVIVMYTPLANAQSAAELTLASILAASRRLIPAHNQVVQQKWMRDQIVGTELFQKQIGIVGLGRIGSRVSTFFHALGLKVVAYDPFILKKHFKTHFAQPVSYEKLLKTSDIISFHVPKTHLTQNMLAKDDFKNLKKNVVIANLSRGNTIDEKALVQFLKNNPNALACLDVYSEEPLKKDSALIKYYDSIQNQIVLTPHVGANTDEAFFKASQMAAKKVLQFFFDGSTSDVLNTSHQFDSTL